jgi:hypothetical protein
MQTKRAGTVATLPIDDPELQILRQAQYPSLTDHQFEFLHIMHKRLGLDIWRGHGCVVSAPGKVRNELRFLLKLEGMRARAADGDRRWSKLGPFWAGPDLHWQRGWNGADNPFVCRVGICPAGDSRAHWGVAHWSECAMKTMGDRGELELAPFWQQRPRIMIAKVAEAFALRSAFPDRLSGIYTPDEIQPNASPAGDGPSGDGMSLPQIDDSTPETAEQLERMLVRDFEFAGEAERKAFVAGMRSKHEHLYSTDRRRFYAAVVAAARKIGSEEVVGSA